MPGLNIDLSALKGEKEWNVGMELNKEQQGKDFDMTLRPQMRLALPITF